MANTMQVSLVAADREVWSGEATVVNARTLAGEIGIMANHQPIMSVLASGQVDVRTVDDQAVALRLVVLADRMYDRDLPVVASGVPFDRLFAPELLAGGYKKKYFRAISRLVALAREGAGLSDAE